jgi:hypothetical protein
MKHHERVELKRSLCSKAQQLAATTTPGTSHGTQRLHWHNFYARCYNKTLPTQAEHLAVWYLLLHLAFDEVES